MYYYRSSHVIYKMAHAVARLEQCFDSMSHIIIRSLFHHSKSAAFVWSGTNTSLLQKTGRKSFSTFLLVRDRLYLHSTSRQSRAVTKNPPSVDSVVLPSLSLLTRFRSSSAVSTLILPIRAVTKSQCYQVSHSTCLFHSNGTKKHSGSKENNTHRSSRRTCWKCNSDTDPKKELFFCKCGVVQKPAKELTYFHLLNMDEIYNIDVKQLGKVFRETQMKLHPDKYSNKSQVEKIYAEEQSSLLNKAYFTLLKPLSRAIYILELAGITITESDTFTDPEFLMDIMKANEQISNASRSVDVDSLEESNNDKMSFLVEEISQAYEVKDFEKMKYASIKLRYFTTIEERIKELRRSLL